MSDRSVINPLQQGFNNPKKLVTSPEVVLWGNGRSAVHRRSVGGRGAGGEQAKGERGAAARAGGPALSNFYGKMLMLLKYSRAQFGSSQKLRGAQRFQSTMRGKSILLKGRP